MTTGAAVAVTVSVTTVEMLVLPVSSVTEAKSRNVPAAVGVKLNEATPPLIGLSCAAPDGTPLE